MLLIIIKSILQLLHLLSNICLVLYQNLYWLKFQQTIMMIDVVINLFEWENLSIQN